MSASGTKRARKGEGLVRERSPGKWEARITVNGHKKSFYGNSEKEVAKKLKEFKQKLAGGVSQHKNISYSDFLEVWLERKKLQIKEQSFSRLESTIKVHIEPAIGYFSLDKIDARLIQEELINAKCEKLGHSSVKKIYDALNASFKFAKSSGYLISNPVDLVVMPSDKNVTFDRADNNKQGSLEILTDYEVKRFVEAATSKYADGKPIYKYGKMFVLMLYTGIRMGEASAIKWSNFDEVMGDLTISSTIIKSTNEEGKAIFKEQKHVKTSSGFRVLKLNEQALDTLYPRMHPTSDYIFCNRHGGVLRPRHIQDTLDSILKKAGIPHKSTHVFRHTFASKLFRQGVDVKIVSELLGHANVTITYNRYITLIQKQKAQAIETVRYF